MAAGRERGALVRTVWGHLSFHKGCPTYDDKSYFDASEQTYRSLPLPWQWWDWRHPIHTLQRQNSLTLPRTSLFEPWRHCWATCIMVPHTPILPLEPSWSDCLLCKNWNPQGPVSAATKEDCTFSLLSCGWLPWLVWAALWLSSVGKFRAEEWKSLPHKQAFVVRYVHSSVLMHTACCQHTLYEPRTTTTARSIDWGGWSE